MSATLHSSLLSQVYYYSYSPLFNNNRHIGTCCACAVLLTGALASCNISKQNASITSAFSKLLVFVMT